MARKVEGLKELNRNLDKLAKVGGSENVKRGVQSIAEEMRDRIIQRAPLGPTGNLKRSIVAKPFQKKGRGLSFVAVDRKIAPHAGLVEFGHGGPRPAPPHPFFRPVIDSYKGEAYKTRMAGILKAEIERAVH